MNDQEINVAIAEVCGWKQSGTGWWFNADNTNGGDAEPPDYCNDLNAMQSAEYSLWKEQDKDYDPFVRREYLRSLDGVTHDQWRTVSATARQRAEAFLRTLGKWKE